MKKLIIIFSLFLSTNALANVITVQPFSNDSSVTHMENFRGTVVTVINGNIAGSSGGTSSVNILADSIGEIDMADDANPRLRDSELLNIGVDTTSAQTTYVYEGCTPATDSDLTSDISACTAYVNGYRVEKTETAQTYPASMDTYLDISQTGNYTISSVANGGAAPAVAANSARLAKVITSGTAITTVTDLARRTLNGLAVATNYRDGCFVSRDSATTVTVLPGVYEVNGSMLSKTSTTTLTISSASDWAGGTSLRAADTMAFVGSDSSGNLKLHTTAPTHDNYALTGTTGRKRYASWSAATYRILGWLYMDGAQAVGVSSNIKEGNVPNKIISQDPSVAGVSQSFSTNSTTDVDFMRIPFYASGNPVNLRLSGSGSTGSSAESTIFNISQDQASVVLFAERKVRDATGVDGVQFATETLYNAAQGQRLMRARARVSGNTFTASGRTFIVEES